MVFYHLSSLGDAQHRDVLLGGQYCFFIAIIRKRYNITKIGRFLETISVWCKRNMTKQPPQNTKIENKWIKLYPAMSQSNMFTYWQKLRLLCSPHSFCALSTYYKVVVAQVKEWNWYNKLFHVNLFAESVKSFEKVVLELMTACKQLKKTCSVC